MALLALFVFASLTWFAWQSFVGFDLLGKLALSLVLDFEQLLSFFLQISMIFWQKTASFRFLVGLLTLLGFHKLLGLLGWLAKLARSLVLDFEQILSFFLQQDQPPQNLEVEHDFLKIILPMVILKFVVFLSMLFWKKKSRTNAKQWSWAWFSENCPTNVDFEIRLASPKLHQSCDVTKIVTSQI